MAEKNVKSMVLVTVDAMGLSRFVASALTQENYKPSAFLQNSDKIAETQAWIKDLNPEAEITKNGISVEEDGTFNVEAYVQKGDYFMTVNTKFLDRAAFVDGWTLPLNL